MSRAHIALLASFLSTACAVREGKMSDRANQDKTCKTGTMLKVPRGADFAATTSTAVMDTSSSPKRFLFDLTETEVRVYCETAVTNAWVCWSQDPTPTIAEGIFSVDVDSIYAAGNGSCSPIPGGSWDYLAISRSTFLDRDYDGDGDTDVAIGARRRQCGSTQEPCAANAECTSGTCGTARSTRTYLFIQPETAAGRCYVTVCDP